MSMITDDMAKCFICGSMYKVEKHHVFNGANRKHSEKYKLVVPLCHYHHTGSMNSVHQNQQMDEKLKRYAQRKFEEKYGHDLFMKVFKKSYI